MRRVVLTALVCAFGLATSVNGVMAADEKMRDVKDRAAFTMDSSHVDSKHVIGMKVNTPDGKHVGEIDRLVMNLNDGKVTHAVVGLGGLVGVGEKHVVVPWSQVKISGADRKDMVAIIDRATLDSARRFTADGRDHGVSASPSTAPSGDRDRDGVANKYDRAPNNPKKQ